MPDRDRAVSVATAESRMPEPDNGAGSSESWWEISSSLKAAAPRPLGPLGRLFRRPARWWVVDEPLQTADAIVVLAGDCFLGGRLRRALEIYHQGWAPRVVLSGGLLRPRFSEAAMVEQEAIELGLPRQAVLLASHDAGTTLEEALVLSHFLAEHNLQRVIAVTSNFHTRRARTIYRALTGMYGMDVRVVAAPDLRFNPDCWWQPRAGLLTLAGELLSLFYAWRELRRLARPLPQPKHVKEIPAELLHRQAHRF